MGRGVKDLSLLQKGGAMPKIKKKNNLRGKQAPAKKSTNSRPTAFIPRPQRVLFTRYSLNQQNSKYIGIGLYPDLDFIYRIELGRHNGEYCLLDLTAWKTLLRYALYGLIESPPGDGVKTLLIEKHKSYTTFTFDESSIALNDAELLKIAAISRCIEVQQSVFEHNEEIRTFCKALASATTGSLDIPSSICNYNLIAAEIMYQSWISDEDAKASVIAVSQLVLPI